VSKAPAKATTTRKVPDIVAAMNHPSCLRPGFRARAGTAGARS
jgi:hypothetical protein